MSLRDVERTMIVFKYMYGMMKVFGSLINNWAKKELTVHEENEYSRKVSMNESKYV